MKPIGTIEPVNLREVWPDEARDFTPWLAKDVGLELLSETLGLQLDLESIEKNVGPYKTDILAKVVDEDEDEDHFIVIENQLAQTDHDHLGKIITYAAGHGAIGVVWIAESFTDEHRQAIDWLNENMTNIDFFGLEIKLGNYILDAQIAFFIYFYFLFLSIILLALLFFVSYHISPYLILKVSFNPLVITSNTHSFL